MLLTLMGKLYSIKLLLLISRHDPAVIKPAFNTFHPAFIRTTSEYNIFASLKITYYFFTPCKFVFPSSCCFLPSSLACSVLSRYLSAE
jgi:hypothetical protein